MKELFAVAVGLVAVLCLSLLVSDRRVLVGERRVAPGSDVAAESQLDAGIVGQETLVCTYFTGRDLKEAVYAYSPNNAFGRDACPFLWDRRAPE